MKKSILVVCAFLMFYGNSFAAKWLPLPATDIKSKCPPNNFKGSSYSYAKKCRNVVRAWSGAVWDDANRAMYIWGGGHGDYIGNEVYKLDLSLTTGVTMTRITDPDIWPAGIFGPCVDEVPGTNNPVSRHTYGNMAFIPATSSGLAHDHMWIFGGARACGSGGFGADTWMLDLTTKAWTKKNPTGTNPGRTILFAAYHPGNNKVYTINGTNTAFYAYDVASNTWSRLRVFGKRLTTGNTSYRNSVIVGNDYYFIGGNGTNAGGLWKINVNGRPDYEFHQITTTGATEIEYATCPGFAYDSKRNLLVAWNGGSPSETNYTDPTSIYTLNMTTWVWTKTTVTANAPVLTASPPHGVWGRFAYSSKMDCYVVISDYDQNATLFCPDDYPTDLWFSRTLNSARESTGCDNGRCKHIRMGQTPDGLIYVFGGDKGWGSSSSTLTTYNVDTDTWTLKIPDCPPDGVIQLDGMDEGALMYNSSNGKFYYFFAGSYCHMCRAGASCTTSYVYDPNCSYGNCHDSAMVTKVNIRYDPTTNTWDPTPLKKPSGHYTPNWGTYDPILNRTIHFIGYKGGIERQYYDIQSNSWGTKKDFPFSIDLRRSITQGSFAHDKVSRVIYLWGTSHPDNSDKRIWKYDIAADTMISFDTNAPGKLDPVVWYQYYNIVWDSANDVMLIPQCEDTGASHPMQFHSFDPKTHVWKKNMNKNSWNGKQPWGREGIYDSVHNLLIILGYNQDNIDGTNQMWFYRYGGGAGTSTDKTPPSTLKNPRKSP